MYDAIIIGGGPAGLAAAVYAARQKISFIVLAKNIGGQTAISADIENYLGFTHTSGAELSKKFEGHVAANKAEIKEGEEAVSLQKIAHGFKVTTNAGVYETAAILIASGKKPRRLNIPGENEYYGKGLTYCATCEAPLYGDKDVAVIGGGNSAMDAALLAEKYSRTVYLITVNPELMGEAAMQELIKKSGKVTVLTNARTTEVFGDNFVKGIKVDVGGTARILNVTGVFVEVGSIPSVDFDRLTEKNKYSEIEIHSEGMMTNMASVPGIFAAGDVTDIPEKQISVAAGEGVKAILSIFQYLRKGTVTY